MSEQRKCIICGAIITEENEVDEDTKEILCARIDRYGMTALTENEQVLMDLNKEVCLWCIS